MFSWYVLSVHALLGGRVVYIGRGRYCLFLAKGHFRNLMIENKRE